MTYSKLKDTQQAAFNNFEGIIFAYSNKQLDEGLARRKTCQNSTAKS